MSAERTDVHVGDEAEMLRRLLVSEPDNLRMLEAELRWCERKGLRGRAARVAEEHRQRTARLVRAQRRLDELEGR